MKKYPSADKLHDLLEELVQEIFHTEYIHPEDIPNIDLYMDQVTTFMDTRLHGTKRNPDDKILTKTMINNYAKNNLFPAPVRKKYTKDHLIFLTFIYYMKSFLTIRDIELILEPLRELIRTDAPLTVDDVLPRLYSRILSIRSDALTDFTQYVQTAEARMEKIVKETMTELPDQEGAVALFAMIADLSIDIYTKKTLLEKLIDRTLPGQNSKETQATGKGGKKKEQD